MTDIIRILKKQGFSFFPILLYGEKELLWQRNAQRTYVVPRQEFEELYDNVMQKVGPEELRIKVTDGTPEQTLSQIILALKRLSSE